MNEWWDKIIVLKILREFFAERLTFRYPPKGLLLNLGLDLGVANTGLFLGYMVTAAFYLATHKELGREWLFDILLVHWSYTLPLFTVVCGLCFVLSGLYGRRRFLTLTQSMIGAFQAISLAFLLYIFLAFLLQQVGGVKFFMLPRSSIVVGWATVLILFSLVRGGKFYLKLHYIFLPRRLEQHEQPSTGTKEVTEEFNWVPVERVQFAKGESLPVSAYFAMWPYFAEDTLKDVSEVLRSGQVNRWTGRQGDLFEQEFAHYCQCRHAIAVANGTLALELAMKALNIGPGDEVIVPCRTFIATASSVVMCGAIPVLADVDRDSQNLTPGTISRVLTVKTRAVIVVHLSGWPCDMDPILALAKERNLKVIEDCAQAHGAFYKGRPVGGLADVGAFSFCQDKILTTGGEGGMLTTNDAAVWKRAWAIKDHGKDYDAVHNGGNRQHGYQWLHEDFGTNWRLTEMQAVIGRSQLKKLPGWLESRRRYGAMLSEAFSRVPGVRVTVPSDDVKHSYYKYYVFVRPEMLKKGWGRDRIIKAINQRGIPCYTGICGQLQQEKAFVKRNLVPEYELPVGEELMATSLMFLVHPTLMDRNILDTINVVQEVLAEAVGQR